MKHQKMTGTVLTVCALLLSLAGCGPSFEGTSVKNADSYALDIVTMNGTDSHTLELEQGDALKIQFAAVQGSLSVEITDPDGSAIYQGDGTAATRFTLNVPADGAYTISVEGKRAQGSIRVDVEKVPALTEEEPWKTALAEDLLEKYGVIPEAYEDLGDGIYQVYVEVGGEVVPFVTVDSATGDYHG